MRTIAKLAGVFSLALLLGSGPTRAVESLPEFQLQGLNNADLATKDVEGKPLVIQFWASWCTSCGGVTKQLGDLLQRAKVKPRVVSISLDETKEAAAKGAPRMRVPGAASQAYYFDQDRRFADRLGQVAVPTVLVIGAKGEILSRISGHWGDAQVREIEARLTEL